MFEAIDGELDDCSDDFIQWINVTFSQDFLIWKQGESVEIFSINFDTGECTEWEDMDTVVKKCQARITLIK